MTQVPLSSSKLPTDFSQVGVTNDFMFGYIMRDTQMCKRFLSRILDMEIDHIEVLDSQKTIDLKLDAHGIRLDIYAEGGCVIYNCEMQTLNKDAPKKRSRYYQSQIDMNLIDKGDRYENLRKSYVIFICTFDLFGRKQYLYTFENMCHEVPELFLEDGTTKVFVNSRGEKGNVSEGFIALMKYINDERYVEETDDPLIHDIDRAVKEARSNKKWRHDYMTYGMKMQEKYEEGMEKGLEKGLEALIFSLRSLVDDFDKVYAQIRRNEVYANVTPEMVRKYYK